MKESDIVAKLNQAILATKSSLDAVSKWSEMLAEKHGVEPDVTKEKAKNIESSLSPEDFTNEDEKVLEGIFNGQNMVDGEGKEYPVPTNYASKSKLVEGDKLKLTIKPNGAFIYKQLELVPRELKTGHLILDGSQYKVLDEERSYNVLYASVTFFRAQVGDKVAVIVPEGAESSWAAIENVIPAGSEEIV